MKTTETRSYCTYCFHYVPARHVHTRGISDKYSPRKSHTEMDRVTLCRKRLKHDDMNVSINAALKNNCRAGNATCMKRSVQDDMNGHDADFPIESKGL
jgi:hypothetical protein